MSATTSARRTPTAAPTVHLTRRGRALAILLFAAVLLGAFSLGRTASQAASPSSPATTTAVQHATVQPGDSLWSVARRVAPDNDPREVVEQIRRLNDLTSADIQVGQQLLLPVAA
jgi:LysM repeat protein